MFCSHCGRKLSDYAKFCNSCGQAVAASNSTGEGTPPTPPPGQPNGIPTQTLPGTVMQGGSPAPGVPPAGMPPGGMPPQSGMPPAPPRKKRGCLIAVIILAVLVLIAGGLFLFWLLGDTPLLDGNGEESGIVTDGTVQGVDVKDLMTPADMRGTGMPGYWVLEGLSDQQGHVYEEADDAMILYLGEDGICAIRSDDGASVDETEGEWRENLMILRDENEGMEFEVTLNHIDENLYVNLGEEDFLLCFTGPYTEDALLYQCTEFFKAASFMTSSLVESPEEMELSYDQWDGGMGRTVDYWRDLQFTSCALDMAADRYLAAGEGQAKNHYDWVNNVLDFLKPLDVYAGSYDAEEVYGVMDKAAGGQKIKALADHFNVTADEAADIMSRTRLEVTEQAYKDEMFYAKCETTCRYIKTGSKVGVFICGTIASGGATGVLSAGEGAAFIIQGADIAMEINEESAYIAYEIEGKQSAKKTLEGVRQIRSVTAPAASIVGLKGLAGNGFDQFMVLNDAVFDAKDGKILAIQVTDPATGKMEVAHVTPEQLEQWKQDKGADPPKLTEQDKKDVWAEIWAKVDEMEEQERLEAGGEPTPEATAEPAEEPINVTEEQADEESAGEEDTDGNMRGWVGEWLVYGYVYNGGIQEDDNTNKATYMYTFSGDGTVDIDVIDLTTGETGNLWTGRKGHWEGDSFVIEIDPAYKANSEHAPVFGAETTCTMEGDHLILEYDNPYAINYALKRR